MDSTVTERARRLRRGQTNAESKLWRCLRNRQLDGAKFRRQTPIGRYVVDFFCEEESLIVELDGGQHAIEIEADQARTYWLETHGYRVIRFWNNEVLENLEGVLERIRRFIGS